MKRIDFYDLNGQHIDQCEPWQLDVVLPVLQVLYGAVTQVETQVAPVVTDVTSDLFAWIDAGCPRGEVVTV